MINTKIIATKLDPASLFRAQMFHITKKLELEAKPQDLCDHGVTFDQQESTGLSSFEIKKRWPRLYGRCPKNCGYNGIAYASYMHYLAGDW